MLKEITRSLDKFLIVSNLPIFEDLAPAERVYISNRATLVECGKGTVLYHEGDSDLALYVVVTGRVVLYHPAERSKEEKDTHMETLRKGDVFGIVSILTGRVHSASARVISDARILKIEHIPFNDITRNIPSLGLSFSRVLSRRLNESYMGKRAVFQNHIIAVYHEADNACAARYCRALAEAITRESGKKAAMVDLDNREGVSPDGGIHDQSLKGRTLRVMEKTLKEMAAKYDYTIVNLPGTLGPVERHILEESDITHIIFSSEKHFRDRASAIMGLAGSKAKDTVKVLMAEEHAVHIKAKSLQEGLYATLPHDGNDYNKTVRRIARDTAGMRVGVALGSGGALGLAEIGVLEILEEEKIPVDIIAGTSIGALISALWASGYPAAEVVRICSAFDSATRALSLIDLTLPKRGLMGGENIRKFLTVHMGGKTFQDTRLPLRVIACDISRREEVVISSGKLVDAVMASIAIPGVFNPVHMNGKILVDGGVITPVPVGALSREGVKRVIAVNCMPSPEDLMRSSSKSQSIIDIMINSFYAMEYKIAKYACQEADIYIHPILKGADWYEFYRAKEFVKHGREEARKLLPEIKRLVKG